LNVIEIRRIKYFGGDEYKDEENLEEGIEKLGFTNGLVL
jgi:hypothetical protein